MTSPTATAPTDWSGRLPAGVRPYLEAAPLAAAFLGVSSGFAFAMIAATLTTRLAQYGIRKSAVTAFALTFLAYNFKFLWAPFLDTLRLPVLGRFGQRRSWLWLVGTLVMAAVAFLGSVDPATALPTVATAAILVGVRRRHLRHRHRRLSYRAARAPSARRRVGDVAVRLADRRRIGRRRGAVDRRAQRLGSGLHHVRAVRAAGDAHRGGDGRAAAPPAASAAARAACCGEVAYFSPLAEFLRRAARWWS